MSPELFSFCRMFRVLHVNLLVKKRSVHPRYNLKYAAWKLARSRRATGFLRITRCF
jgi:hypothetical protein